LVDSLQLGREVPFPPELVANLKAHIHRWPPIGGRASSNGAGRPIPAHNYGKVWRRERALLWPTGHPCSGATVYDLRHTAATMMLRAGVNPSEVALRLGHSVDMLMKVYAGVFDDERNRSNTLIEKELRETT
jgi:integrase